MTMSVVACETTDKPEDQPTPTPPTPGPSEYSFKLTSDGAMVFDDMGGTSRIDYLLSDTAETLDAIELSHDSDWILNLKDEGLNEDGIGRISFTVKRNNGGETRSCTITATYKEQSFNVMINQRSNSDVDVTVTATSLVGFYYGNRDGGDYSYYIALTDGDIVYEGTVTDPTYGSYEKYTYSTPNAYYYLLDVYSTQPADKDNIRVPDGTYTYDTANTGLGDQIMSGFSLYQLNDAGGWPAEQWIFSNATLVVEGNRFELTANLVDDDYNQIGLHFVTFEGDYQLIDDSL